MNPKVSVIIITYKQAGYIRQSIESVLCQKTNFPFEVIIADDCSNDGTAEILIDYQKRYPDVIKCIINEANVGASKNTYNAQVIAKGQYVCGLEGDDYWIDSNKLQKQVDYLDAHPECEAVGGNNVFVDSEGNNPTIALYGWQTNKTYYLKDYLRYGFIIHGNTLMRRNDWPLESEKYKKLKFSAPTMGDVISRVLIYDKGSIYVFDDLFLAHRDGAVTPTSYSATSKTKALNYTKMYIQIVEALENYLENRYDLKSLTANRLADNMLAARLGFLEIDSKDLRSILNEYDFKFRFMVYRKMIQRFNRRVLHSVYKKVFKPNKSLLNSGTN